MKELKNIMIRIITLTTEIETNYPELYRYLDETPISIRVNGYTDITAEELYQYLDSLQQLLKSYKKTHDK